MTKLVITVILLLSSLAGGLGVVHPHYVTYQTRTEEAEVLQEELENMTVYINDLKRIAVEIEENKEEFAVLRSAFPEDHDAPSLFLYFKNKIEEHNLELSVDIGEFSVRDYVYNGSEHSRIKQTEFGLSFSGRYGDVKNFFRDTEDLIRIITVESVEMGEGRTMDPFAMRGTRQPEGDEISVVLRAKTYSY